MIDAVPLSGWAPEPPERGDPGWMSALLAAHADGYSLPQACYVDPELFEADLERVFAAGWLFAGVESDLPDPGSLLTWTIGRDSVLLVRHTDGVVRAYHNVCRHRGCRLLPDGPASARVIACPYHQWVYGTDGALRGAPHMGPELAREALSLRPVPLREVAGLYFLSLAEDPPPFAAAAEAIAPQLGPHRLDRTRIATRLHYRVEANWKTLVENNRECYHCRVNHPEFCLSNFDLGGAGDSRRNRGYETVLAAQRRRWIDLGLAPAEVSFPDGDFFRVARLPLREGFVTESLRGDLVAPRLGDLPSGDVGSLRVITLPNAWIHANADYAMTTRLTPLSAAATTVDITFLVRSDAVAGRDYDPAELTAVWIATSEQDWALCEQNYAGIRSRGYRPGPLSAVTEGSVRTFHEWYLTALTAPATGCADRSRPGRTAAARPPAS